MSDPGKTPALLIHSSMAQMVCLFLKKKGGRGGYAVVSVYQKTKKHSTYLHISSICYTCFIEYVPMPVARNKVFIDDLMDAPATAKSPIDIIVDNYQIYLYI